MKLKGHLHYGGSVGATFKLRSMPEKGRLFSYQKRLESIIRLENAGFGATAIAAMLCISPTKVKEIKKTSEYLNARVRLTHGIILDHDEQMGAIKEQRKEILTQMLPPALQFLASELQRPAQSLAERKHKSALTQDLLDREGTFAKISKTEIKPVESFDFERADVESAAIIKALRGLPEHQSQHTDEVVEANKQFSNSHTLSTVDQQKALDVLEASEQALTESLLQMPTQGKVN